MTKLTVDRFVEPDRKAICALARQAHEESLFADIPFSEAKFHRAFDSTIREPDACLGLKVSLSSRILGYCYALLGGYYIAEGAKVVTVISIMIDPQVRARILGGKAALRLVRGIETWARGMGADYVLYHATAGTSPMKTDRFFRKLGMTTLGGNYGVRLNKDRETDD